MNLTQEGRTAHCTPGQLIVQHTARPSELAHPAVGALIVRILGPALRTRFRATTDSLGRALPTSRSAGALFAAVTESFVANASYIGDKASSAAGEKLVDLLAIALEAHSDALPHEGVPRPAGEGGRCGGVRRKLGSGSISRSTRVTHVRAPACEFEPDPISLSSLLGATAGPWACRGSVCALEISAVRLCCRGRATGSRPSPGRQDRGVVSRAARHRTGRRRKPIIDRETAASRNSAARIRSLRRRTPRRA
ncbi:MAG: hypothetical protein HY749_06405 [Gammaproteobacteria bacterium]|nr:hypothetical protein [Gammaproteobacteria bacterium]